MSSKMIIKQKTSSSAGSVNVDATGFSGNLSATDDNVQTALETINDLGSLGATGVAGATGVTGTGWYGC